ncbi:MAG: protein translocase subunit SecF [Candidatus Harrisonbacteria bacterium]|nr:protein translocase subunit SecF [Candidatus Harrisonbacteria bacterium]
MNVIGNKYLFLGFSGLLVVASIVAIGALGLKQGIDFTGGTMWQVALGDAGVSADGVKAFLMDELKLNDAIITPQPSTESFLIRTKEIDESHHAEYKAAFAKAYPKFEELRFESIGPAIGSELRRRAVWAFLFVLLGISLYIAFAFRKVSYPVSSWKYGLITLATLFHDAIIPTGLFAVLGYLYHAELDTNFIVAILVVMGFSVHDTIVVFDRIRENLRLERSSKFDFDALVNRSVNETMARSINTSLTLVLVLVALYFFGSPSLAYFTLTILVGTVVGTYSSIFVASPLLTLWRKG